MVHSRSSKARTRCAAGIAVAALLATACSGDHGDDVATAPETTVAAVTTAAVVDADASTETTIAAVTTVAETVPVTDPPGEAFGTLESPCGPGDASGATAKGVTDTDITIGYGDDAGYAAAPGLDKEMSDASKAIIDWCNEQGGINGRQILGTYYDAAVLQITPVITQACSDDTFMLVGQGWVLDSGQEQARIECQLSTIPGFASAVAFANGSGMIQAIPNPGDQVPIGQAFQLAALFPEQVKKAAFVFAEFPATREPRDKYVLAYPQAGWEFLDCDQIYNVAGESDWKPLASNLQACGVEAVVWIGSPDPNMENFLNASRQIGYDPIWLTDPNQYTPSFAEWNAQNDGAADNVYVRMATVPFEFADTVPAVQQYLDLMEASGGMVGQLGIQSISAFLLWATAVDECGSNVTAKCVLDSAAAQTEWTAGGLHVPSNPGGNEGTKCGMLLKLDAGEWTKVTPSGDEVFACDDSYLATGLQTAAVAAAAIGPDRIATQFGTFTPT